MRFLITGADGQLGHELQRLLDGTAHSVVALARPQLDVTDRVAAAAAVAEIRPDWLINAAAYTDTAGCERDPARALAVNTAAPGYLAAACRQTGVGFLHLSTNEVFDGRASEPYPEDAPTGPLNTYARSKRDGEWATLRTGGRAVVVRTAWLYGAAGTNFIDKLLAAADRQGALSVVDDEIATPTWARDLAATLLALIAHRPRGLYHLTNAGSCSRFEWARQILALTGRGQIPLTPTTLAAYPGATVKPPMTALANQRAAALGIRLRPWPEALAEYLAGGTRPPRPKNSTDELGRFEF